MRYFKQAAALVAVPLLAGAGALAAGGTARAATTPLPVSFSADGNGSAAFDAHGVPVLTLGTSSDSTFAQLSVNLKAVGHSEPKTAPSLKSSGYAAGAPRWDVLLSDGYYLFGFPKQLGGGATDDFTGPQWSVQGPSATACGASYVTYAKALSCADPSGSGHVTQAYVVADADQPPGTADTLSAVQYAGQSVGTGTVTVGPVADQSATVGTPFTLTLHAATTSSDPALTFAAQGLPAGLSLDAVTGVVSGTPAANAQGGQVTVTAQDAYGTVSAAVTFNLKVSAPVSAAAPVVLSHGGVVPGSLLPTRAVTTWAASPAAPGGYRVTITGPNFPGGRTAVVHVTKAGYTGLASGHTYVDTITPLGADGHADGATGHVTFITPR